MEIRLIASDIDGTLLCHGRAASAVTAAAVRDCRAAGVEFAIASGRWFPSARDVAVGQLGIGDGYRHHRTERRRVRRCLFRQLRLQIS